MTNKEAIAYLEGQWNCMCSEDCRIYTGHKDCPQGFICTDGQALQAAISALEKQDVPDANVGDTISRQAAIDVIEAGRLTKLIDAETAVNGLKALPSAQPDRKHGKWIYHIDDIFPAESTMECDQCHAEQPLTCDDEYCPHCGARMEDKG